MDGWRHRIVCSLIAVVVVSGVSTPQIALGQRPSPEVTEILDRWKSAVAKLDRYEITGQSIVYNNVFDRQRVANFVIQYESPQSLRFDIHPIENPLPSQRKNPRTRAPYKIETVDPSITIWRGEHSLRCVPGTGQMKKNSLIESRFAEVVSAAAPEPFSVDDLLLKSRPDAMRIQPIGPFQQLYLAMFLPQEYLPSLFAVDAPEFFDQFEWKMTRLPNGVVRLDGTPTTTHGKELYLQLSVLIDAETGRPLAQKTVDFARTSESVYIFQKWNMEPANFDFDLKLQQYDYEFLALPPELVPLSHRVGKEK